MASTRNRLLTTSKQKVHVTDGFLHDVTNDCLRFVLRFFRPILASAQHIYHTALPLSPETSTLRQRFFETNPFLTTQQASSSKIPATWGPILRTIKADSGSFTHVAVAGRRVVAVCSDNTVNVYDAVTGVLRLSLDPPQQVTKAEGSPDGSILFFAHQRAHEITVWDTQTGGLIHTLTTMSDINDIAVSSNGTYLGSCLSNRMLQFWDLESRYGGSHSLDQVVVRICWLEPDGQVALADEGAIVILEVTTGKILRRCRLEGRVQELTFSAHRHRLAVALVWETEGKVMTLDTRTGVMSRSPNTLHDLFCLTFSDDGSRVICGTDTGHLLSYNPETSFTWDHHLKHLGTIHSMNVLRGGRLVVNSGESIQLLGSEYARPSTTSLGLGTSHVYQVDNKIYGSSEDHTNAKVLHMETMKTLTHHRPEFDQFDASRTPRLLCASTSHDITIFRLWKRNGSALTRFGIGQTYPTWEQLSSRPVLLGALSPHGWYIVTVSGGEDPSGGGDWELCIRETRSGNVLNEIPFILTGRPPSKIAFTSEKQFYTEERRVFSTPPLDEDESDCEVIHEDDCEDKRVQARLIPRAIMPKQPGAHHTGHRARKPVTRRPDEIMISTTNSEGQPHTGVRHGEYRIRKFFSLKIQPPLIPWPPLTPSPSSTPWPPSTPLSRVEIEEVPGEEILPGLRSYSLDDSLEWVVDAESRRVCWLPPGYVTGIEDGHFFVGSSLVTAGQDGIVRKLTFREPGSGS